MNKNMNKKVAIITLLIMTLNIEGSSEGLGMETKHERAETVENAANNLVFDTYMHVIAKDNLAGFYHLWSSEIEKNRALYIHSWQRFSNTSLLGAALYKRQTPIVKTLLEAGAKVHNIDMQGRSAFTLLSTNKGDTPQIIREKKELIKLILGSSSPEDCCRYVLDQSYRGNVNVLEAIHEDGYDFNAIKDEKGKDLLDRAINGGQLELVAYLCNNGINLRQDHLHAATQYAKMLDDSIGKVVGCIKNGLQIATKKISVQHQEVASDRANAQEIILYLCTQGLKPDEQDFVGQADDVVALLHQILKNKNKNRKKKANKKRKDQKKTGGTTSADTSAETVQDDDSMYVSGEEEIAIPALPQPASFSRSGRLGSYDDTPEASGDDEKVCSEDWERADHDNSVLFDHEQSDENDEKLSEDGSSETLLQNLVGRCNHLYDLLEQAHELDTSGENQVLMRELFGMVAEKEHASRIMKLAKKLSQLNSDVQKSDAAKDRREQLEIFLNVDGRVNITCDMSYTPSTMLTWLRFLLKDEYKNSINALACIKKLLPKTENLYIPMGLYSGHELLSMIE